MKTQKLINFLCNKKGCGYDKGKRTFSRRVGTKIYSAKIVTSEPNDIQDDEARPLLKKLGFSNSEIGEILNH